MTAVPFARARRLLATVAAAALLVAVPLVATATAAPGLHRTTGTGVVPDPVRGLPSTQVAAPPVAAAPDRSVLAEPALPAPEGRAQAAVDAAQAAARETTELGVAVLDRRTGEKALGTRGAEPFLTASLSKLVLAVDVLDRRRTEGLPVTDADLDLIRRALGPSDDGAMNTLWTRFDGIGAAARVSARLGLTATTAPDDPSQWGEMRVSPADYLTLYDHVLTAMPSGDQDFLVGSLAAATPQAAGGFDQAFGLLSPGLSPGAAAKQGWMCCIDRVYDVHSVGAVGTDQRYVVALLTRVPLSGGYPAATAEVTAVATAALQPLA